MSRREVSLEKPGGRHAPVKVEDGLKRLKPDDSDEKGMNGRCVQVSEEQIFFPTCAIKESAKTFLTSVKKPASLYKIRRFSGIEGIVLEAGPRRRLTLREVLDILLSAKVLEENEIERLVRHLPSVRQRLEDPLDDRDAKEINICIRARTFDHNLLSGSGDGPFTARKGSDAAQDAGDGMRENIRRGSVQRISVHQSPGSFEPRPSNVRSSERHHHANDESKQSFLYESHENSRSTETSSQRAQRNGAYSEKLERDAVGRHSTYADSDVDDASYRAQFERLLQVCRTELGQPVSSSRDRARNERSKGTLRTLQESSSPMTSRKVLSDAHVQNFVRLNNTAVDVIVEFGKRQIPAVARIDGMSGGCFVSPRFLDLHGITFRQSRNGPSFDCPHGVLATRGEVPLNLSWKTKDGTPVAFTICFNIPEQWQLDIDLLVTVPMALATGMRSIAYPADPERMVIPIYDRKSGPVYFVKRDQNQREQDQKTNNETKRKNQQNEEWLKQQKQQKSSDGRSEL